MGYITESGESYPLYYLEVESNSDISLICFSGELRLFTVTAYIYEGSSVGIWFGAVLVGLGD